MLYLHYSHFPTLALKLFRGEPAISEFDWNFSAIHSSSHAFSTATWFGPPRSFTLASTWPWIGHPVSGLMPATSCALFRLALATAPELQFLNLATYRNSLARSTKSTSSHSYGALIGCGHMVSGSISLPSRGTFHLSLTVLLHYRSLSSI